MGVQPFYDTGPHLLLCPGSWATQGKISGIHNHLKFCVIFYGMYLICLLQWVIEGNIKWRIEVTGRWGRRCRKLLDDLKERRGCSHLKEEALDRTMWRARFGRGFGPVVRQTTKWMHLIYKCGYRPHNTTWWGKMQPSSWRPVT